MPLLLALDPKTPHDVVFAFDPETKQWVVRFETRETTQGKSKKRRGDAP
jgi:hypothetical protein